MGKKTILDVRVAEVEKRRYPTKHYVYVLEVSWSEGSSVVVYRRYSDFFEFQCLLLEKFPVEGGAKDPAQRMIPFLPGKKLFGRSNIRTVAEKRKEKIDEYCRNLIRLPPNISDSQFVRDFFEIRQTDLEKPKKPKVQKGQPKINEISDPLILERYVAIADYEKQKKNECTVMAGQTVEVIDKNDNGWWFVNVDDFHEGWVPATYLEPLYGTEDTAVQKLEPGEEETWIAMNRYESQHHDELGFEKGVLLEVFEKGIDGWWKARYQDKEGMVPAAYLQRYHGSGAGQASTGAELVGTLKDATSLVSKENTLVQSTPAVVARAPSKTSPAPTPVLRSPTLSPSSSSAHQSLSNSLSVTSPTPAITSPTTRSHPTPKSPPGDAPEEGGDGSQSAARTIPAASPKPEKFMAVAALAAAEKQKFAPTWHSQANKPSADKEPIYGPTPRRYSFKKPPLKKKDPSKLSVCEPVYEIIPEPEAEVYMTIAEFSATAGDSINFQAGAVCTVVTKNPNGWWYVDMDGNEGWVPSSYLEKVSGGSSDSSPTKTKKSANPTEPPSKPAKFEPKIAIAKVEPVKEVKRKETLASHKPVVPTVQPRKTFSSSSTSRTERKSSLRRSTSTDSGLNEDVDGNKLTITPMRSPPMRSNAAPPRPSRPKASPAVPNGPKSPRTGSKTGTRSSLKPAISGPVSVQVSPAARRKSEAASAITAGSNAKMTISDPLTSRNARTPPSVKRPPPMKHRTNDNIPGSSKTSGSYSKKTSAPDLPGGLRNSMDKRPLATSRTSPSLTRLNSGSAPAMNGYKQELEKKFNNAAPSNMHSSQQPIKPSPPNRPKAPQTKSTSVEGPQRPSAPPSRPQPPKSGPAKKPSPPVARPLVAPRTNRSPTYVTMGSYSAEGALNFEEGVEVEVIEKKDDGWWYVSINGEEGWAPSTYIEEKTTGAGAVSPGISRPPRPKPHAKSSAEKESASDPMCAGDDNSKPRPRPRPRKATKTLYRATDSFNDEGSMQLVKGQTYELKEKNDSGWWLVKHGEEEGWAPSNYLQQF